MRAVRPPAAAARGTGRRQAAAPGAPPPSPPLRRPLSPQLLSEGWIPRILSCIWMERPAAVYHAAVAAHRNRAPRCRRCRGQGGDAWGATAPVPSASVCTAPLSFVCVCPQPPAATQRRPTRVGAAAGGAAECGRCVCGVCEGGDAQKGGAGRAPPGAGASVPKVRPRWVGGGRGSAAEGPQQGGGGHVCRPRPGPGLSPTPPPPPRRPPASASTSAPSPASPSAWSAETPSRTPSPSQRPARTTPSMPHRRRRRR